MTEKILAITRVTSKGGTQVPITVRQLLKVGPKEYIAWVRTETDIVVRKGKWEVPKKTYIIELP